MRDVLDEVVQQWEAGGAVGLGTVVAAFSSAPRLPGAAMAVFGNGVVAGSVSGGCVEGAVYETAHEVLSSGSPQLQRYGFTDDDAFAVGLTCGGIIDVFVEKVDGESFPQLGAVARDIRAGNPVALATVIEHPDPTWVGRRIILWPDRAEGSLGSERADHAVIDDARGLLAVGRNATLTYGPDGQRLEDGMRVFVSSFAPRPRMIVFGAIDFAAALAQQASFLGYHVTVCDARPVFATPARFPSADEVVVKWPDEYLTAEVEAGNIDPRTVIAVLTHDPKFDVPVLQVALPLEVAYIGAMGSRLTHTDRLERLREAGVKEEHLNRLHSPIGLDLGGRTPEETAVSIMAEVIQRHWGGTAEPLHARDGRIHYDDVPDLPED